MSRPRLAGEPRVLFIQHANPAAYPPIEHAAVLLAEAGAAVHLVGIALLKEVRFPQHPRVSVELLPAPSGGWRLRLGFLRFVWHVCVEVARHRPGWIYASDALATPAIWLATRLWRVRCVYHEHDAPERAAGGLTAKLVEFCRRRVARQADACVVPSPGRAELLRASTGRTETLVIWNTPTIREIAPARSGETGATRLLYHGSIVPARVPETLFHALAGLPPSVSLCVTGYDPSGGDYLANLAVLARDLGIADRVEWRGTVTDRADVMRHCAGFDVGLALLPLQSASANERTMFGASNKVFDYLACGLAVVVPDLPEWRASIVEPGYGLACDPASVESLQNVLRRLDAAPSVRRDMGERGRQRVTSDWNYDRGFRPVLDLMLTATSPAGAGS